MVTFAHDEQAALEAKAAARWERVERGELTPEAGMGTPEEWELRIDEHRLVLVPSTREWLYYDRIHDTWEPTGNFAGEGLFGVEGGELGFRRAAAAAPAPAPRRPRSLLAWLRWAGVLAGLAVSGLGLYRTLSDDDPKPAAERAAPPAQQRPATKTCANSEAGYSLRYPASWATGGEPCQYFDPKPFAVPADTTAPVAIEVLELPDDFETSTVQFTQPGIEVLELQRFSIRGHRALRVLYRAPGEGGPGQKVYQVAVERDGATLVLLANAPFSEDFAATRRVLDAMAASMRFD